MLLEYCDISLKDWLSNIKKVTTDELENMLTFSLNIANGVEHLHKQKVNWVDCSELQMGNKSSVSVGSQMTWRMQLLVPPTAPLLPFPVAAPVPCCHGTPDVPAASAVHAAASVSCCIFCPWCFCCAWTSFCPCCHAALAYPAVPDASAAPAPPAATVAYFLGLLMRGSGCDWYRKIIMDRNQQVRSYG